MQNWDVSSSLLKTWKTRETMTHPGWHHFNGLGHGFPKCVMCNVWGCRCIESAFKLRLSDLILSIIVVRMSDGQVNCDCDEQYERASHMHGGRKQSLCPARQMEEFSPVGFTPVSRSLASLERTTQSTACKPRLFTFPWRRRSTASHLNQQALRIGQAQARWLRLIQVKIFFIDIRLKVALHEKVPVSSFTQAQVRVRKKSRCFCQYVD